MLLSLNASNIRGPPNTLVDKPNTRVDRAAEIITALA
jgi:hypothetical protein